MSQFEFELSDKDFQLVASQDVMDIGTFGATDYIRITIYPTEAIDDIVTLPNSAMGIDGRAIFFASLNSSPFNINISPFGSPLNEIRTKPIGGPLNGDFRIYVNDGNGNIYIKPNEILNDFKLPQGSYKVQVDFLNQVKENSLETEHFQFITKQISTSRKEVRLKLKDKPLLNNSTDIEYLTNQFNFNKPEFLEDTDEASNTFGQFVIPNPDYKYQFKHILNIGTGDHIPIMNYQFDKVTDGRENQSLILKLYEPLPTNIGNLSLVTIEREVLTTQIEEVYYFSDVAEVFFGDGLVADAQENWINPDGNEFQFQNFDELTGSIDNITIDNLISESQYNYPNLNTDFNEFENHTFFGSAKRKLENFRTKVETIQGHYSEISKSLFAKGETVISSSNELIQIRKNLLKKVNDEVKTFSPYERFLYYGGQNESTASAPGIGLNYADTIPVRTGVNNDYIGQINGGDGFNVVYHHSSKNIGGKNAHKYIDLFTQKYLAKDKPFFNYSGSIYLSFLIKGDSGSALTWENRNQTGLGDGIFFPKDALNQTNLKTPDITGSEYRRYIYQASQSFWVPTAEVPDFDLSNMEHSDFNAGSTKIELLSGRIKTGSNVIKDSSNKYQNYTNVITASGVSFTGSVMPAQELFRIFTINELSSSLAGYYRFDETSGTLCEDASGNGFSGSLKFEDAGGLDGGGIRISGSSSDIGRQSSGSAAGNSLFFGETGSAFVQITSSLIPDSELATTDFSITAWINPTSQSQEFDTIVGKRDTEGNGFQFDIRDTDGANDGVHPFGIGFALQASGSSAIADQGTITIPSASWTHVAVTVDRSDAFKLFVNGVKTATSADISARGSGITGSGAFDNPFSIGARLNQDGTTSNRFGGGIDEVRFYKRALRDTEVEQLYLNPDGNINTKITDVRISLKDPTDVLPFDQLYHTSSAEWKNWYSSSFDSASAFDTDNIHSFENNLPLYIQESNDYNDMKDFLSLQGEQYDVIRNHIDSLGTLHNRGYDKTNSPPENTLPMLLSNMGWQSINPFSGSLTDSLGGYLSGVTSIDDIKNQTWRKTLNNLLYIYKSKGTKNSVRALLNVYGYPPDLLGFQEFGGSTEELIGEGAKEIIPDDIEDEEIFDLDLQTGSLGYTVSKEKLYRYMFSSRFQQERILNFDWWMDDANINTFEFIYKHNKTTNTQTILQSSGSGAQKLWDLRLVPSSDGLSSSFEFRINNSQRGGTAIGSRGFSMSSAYNEIADGQLWNVMLQRMTSSVTVGAGTQEYRLHTALQDISKIKSYGCVTMSISGGLIGDGNTIGGKGFFANENFVGSGSRHALSSSNLFVGETLSGSLAEIRGWTTALSTSKFRQHTFNKFSTVGNNITSYEDDLIYHFKLNENYSTASVSSSNQLLTIVDSAPKCSALLTTDYSFQKTGSIFTGSIVYGFDIIDVVQFSTEDNFKKGNDRYIYINPETTINGNLSPSQHAFLNAPLTKPQILNSPDLTIGSSPQDFVDKHILNNLSGFNFEKFYGNPLYYHSSSYTEFDNLRKDFFKCNPIDVNVNDFIRAHENMTNHSIVEGLRTLVPARSSFSDINSNFGVEIRPTILEKQKYENEEQDVEPNPNTATGSIVIVSTETIMTGSAIESIKSGSISVITPESIMSGSEYILPKSGSISVVVPESIMSGSENMLPKSGSISVVVPESIMSGSTVVLPKTGSIDYASHANKSFVNIHDSWGRGKNDVHFLNMAVSTQETSSVREPDPDAKATAGWTFLDKPNEGTTITIQDYDGTSVIFEVDNDGDGASGDNTAMDPPSNNAVGMATIMVSAINASSLKITATKHDTARVVLTQDAGGTRGNTTITLSNSSNWLANTNPDVPSAFTGGKDWDGNNYNIGHIDTRNHFYSIGDMEYYSASFGSGSSDFTDIRRFGSHHQVTNGPAGDVVYNHLRSSGQLTNLGHLVTNRLTDGGQRMGKTRFMRLVKNLDNISKNEQLILPRNHVTNFSNPFKNQMNNGTQNTNPGILNVQYEDYSTSSFYRVKVTGGDNEIIIRVPGKEDFNAEPPPSPQ